MPWVSKSHELYVEGGSGSRWNNNKKKKEKNYRKLICRHYENPSSIICLSETRVFTIRDEYLF